MIRVIHVIRAIRDIRILWFMSGDLQTELNYALENRDLSGVQKITKSKL